MLRTHVALASASRGSVCIMGPLQSSKMYACQNPVNEKNRSVCDGQVQRRGAACGHTVIVLLYITWCGGSPTILLARSAEDLQ